MLGSTVVQIFNSECVILWAKKQIWQIFKFWKCALFTTLHSGSTHLSFFSQPIVQWILGWNLHDGRSKHYLSLDIFFLNFLKLSKMRFWFFFKWGSMEPEHPLNRMPAHECIFLRFCKLGNISCSANSQTYRFYKL